MYSKKEKITTLNSNGGTYNVTKKGKIIFNFIGGQGVLSNYLLKLNTDITIGTRGIAAPSERHIWSTEILVQQGDIIKVEACENPYEINNYFVPYE